MPAFETRAETRANGARYQNGRETGQRALAVNRESRGAQTESAKYFDPIATPLIVSAAIGFMTVYAGMRERHIKKHENLSLGIQTAGYNMVFDTALLALQTYGLITHSVAYWAGLASFAIWGLAVYFLVWKAFGNTPLGKTWKSGIQKAWREATSPRY